MNLIQILIVVHFGVTILLLIKGIIVEQEKDVSVILKALLLLLLFWEVLLIYGLITSYVGSPRLYKTYFDKSDTPFRQDFQPTQKYHIVWKRAAYRTFLKHKVVKVKFLGIFTLFDEGVKE